MNSTTKKILIFGLISAALLWGALFRASRHDSSYSAGRTLERAAQIINSSFPTRDLLPPVDQTSESTGNYASSDEKESDKEGPRGSSSSAIKKKNSRKAGETPNIEALKKGIYPKKGMPGDMKEYLDEAERTRAERIRKALREVQKKVRDWERSIFEPTW